MSPLSKKPSFVVVDYETTGLEAHLHVPLELGMVVVNDNLDVLAEISSIIQPAAMPIWHELHESVQRMHTMNGLIEAIGRGEGSVKAQVEEDFIVFLDQNNATGLPMCGSSVQFDRSWMQVHMPDLAAEFHYRNIDISTIKELCRRYNKRVFDAAPAKMEQHRSLPDCHETLRELDFYIEEFFMVDLV